MSVMYVDGVEGWYIDGENVKSGFALRNACSLDVLLKDPIVRNGMCEVHWDWIYSKWDAGELCSNIGRLTLRYKPPHTCKPIVPASVTGWFDYNGNTGRVIRLESEEPEGNDIPRSWRAKMLWTKRDMDLGEEPTLEAGVVQDSNGYPYIYVLFGPQYFGCSPMQLRMLGKRNTDDLTYQERLDLGLLLPRREFLNHMSLKTGRDYDYDKTYYTEEEDDDDDNEEYHQTRQAEKSTRQKLQLRSDSNQMVSQVFRTPGVESWHIKEDQILYGFALQDALPLVELLKNAEKNGDTGTATWKWVYSRTYHTILDSKELGDGLTLNFHVPEDGQDVTADNVTGKIEYDGFDGDIKKIVLGRGLDGQRAWKLHIDWWFDECKLGSTAVEIGAIEDENGHPFIYLGFNLDKWCPLHLIGKRVISSGNNSRHGSKTKTILTKQERQNLGLKMSVKEFVRHAKKKYKKKYKYDADLDDVVSLYDGEVTGNGVTKVEGVNDAHFTVKKEEI